jgi:hypothetical protein
VYWRRRLGGSRHRAARRESDRAFRTILSSERSELGDVVGLEHEYQVERGGAQVDFGALIHNLGLGVRHLEPSDPNAYPLASGAVLTNDGQEAEIALAPTRIGVGFSFDVAARADAERRALLGLLGPAHELRGYSTHISVATPNRIGERVATMFASRFAVPMMMLLDDSRSPGLLIRPRPGRTEICGEYAAGSRLATALLFAVAAVRACHDLARGDTRRSATASGIDARVVPAVERFGWYVDRRAFGCDLYLDGRSAVLSTLDGGSITAQQALESAWAAVRSTVEGDANAEELAAVDAVASGVQPLPLEAGVDDRLRHGERERDGIHRARNPGHMGPNPLLHPRRRVNAQLELAPVMVTWETVVFLVIDDARTRRAFAVVPRPLLATFAERLGEGELDGALADYLLHAGGDRVLSSHRQTLVPGLYDDVVARFRLLRPEREPSEQRSFELV